MVCASVREDNPRALASELTPVHTQNHTITCICNSMHLYFVHNEILGVKHCNINERCNKESFMQARQHNVKLIKQLTVQTEACVLVTHIWESIISL